MIGNRRTIQDRSKIDLAQCGQMRFWSRSLRASPQDFQRAISKVGDAVAAVRKRLGSPPLIQGR